MAGADHKRARSGAVLGVLLGLFGLEDGDGVAVGVFEPS